MSEGLEKLKSIGAQKIYEKTHIARANVESILEKSFDKIPKVQFKGFISILEREYKVDLQDLVREFEQYTAKEREIAVHLAPEIKKEYVKFDQKTIISLLAATLIIGYLIISSLVHKGSEPVEVNNTEIETAKANLEHNDTAPVVVVDTNESNDTNKSIDINATQAVKPVETAPMAQLQDGNKSIKLEIVPTKTLWLSYIQEGSFKPTQSTISKTLSLDPSKNYLVELGHGFEKIDLGTTAKEYNEQSKKYFKYKNGEFTELSRAEFRELSKDKSW